MCLYIDAAILYILSRSADAASYDQRRRAAKVARRDLVVRRVVLQHLPTQRTRVRRSVVRTDR